MWAPCGLRGAHRGFATLRAHPKARGSQFHPAVAMSPPCHPPVTSASMPAAAPPSLASAPAGLLLNLWEFGIPPPQPCPLLGTSAAQHGLATSGMGRGTQAGVQLGSCGGPNPAWPRQQDSTDQRREQRMIRNMQPAPDTAQPGCCHPDVPGVLGGGGCSNCCHCPAVVLNSCAGGQGAWNSTTEVTP